MARTIRIGGQDFERSRVNNNFYIDKTDFIKKWWEAEDDVTLITRPRRFGKTLNMSMLEQFFREVNQLSAKKNAVWSLLLASGYLKVVSTTLMEETGRTYYDLALTNREVTLMFEIMIQDWFSGSGDYNDFIKALLQDDVDAMNEYMNRVAFDSFSYFDTGKNPGRTEPEKFYHGFVLGLMVDLSDRYLLRSNRESGFGRYDVMLEPKRAGDDAFILEFKVFQPRKEKDLEDTVASALEQIEEKGYAAELLERGFPAERIRRYGFAFCGKE
ncbi:MAG: ATP-binding protein, partial [Lachnospiraceae bacterium]|nr:ATP-binding protein [Lachnospiraceae bacterium]